MLVENPKFDIPETSPQDQIFTTKEHIQASIQEITKGRFVDHHFPSHNGHSLSMEAQYGNEFRLRVNSVTNSISFEPMPFDPNTFEVSSSTYCIEGDVKQITTRRFEVKKDKASKLTITNSHEPVSKTMTQEDYGEVLLLLKNIDDSLTELKNF